MNKIDRIYTDKPFLGRRPICTMLNQMGYPVNIKRVDRLMRLMGISATVPAPHTSVPRKEARKYPYLLGNLAIDRSDLVWAADITYIPLEMGFLYLVAIMDWFARYILSWELSNSMESDFCEVALRRALKKSRPAIFNTDQGAQFTSDGFLKILEDKQIKISMDGKGRFQDNIMIERFWRSLKYEEVYLNHYENGWEALTGIRKYIRYYNQRRGHSSLSWMTPLDFYRANRF